LFDLGVVEGDEPEERFNLGAYFLDGSTVAFDVEPDEVDMLKDDHGFSSQLQRIFRHLEGGADDDDLVWFDDEENECVHIRTKDCSD